jgi:hypothetical protein
MYGIHYKKPGHLDVSPQRMPSYVLTYLYTTELWTESVCGLCNFTLWMEFAPTEIELTLRGNRKNKGTYNAALTHVIFSIVAVEKQ